MTELFTDISPTIKNVIKRIIDITFDSSMKLSDAASIILEFAKTRPHKEQEFIDFYFNLKMEQLKNESNND